MNHHARGKFAKLRWPHYSAPLRVWYAIGGLYYVIFSFVLYRLLRLDCNSALKRAPLMLILFMRVADALWNYAFFRARNLFLSFIVASLFPLMATALFICLIRLDKAAAWSLIQYLLYRVYALWRGYGPWRINGRAA